METIFHRRAQKIALFNRANVFELKSDAAAVNLFEVLLKRNRSIIELGLRTLRKRDNITPERGELCSKVSKSPIDLQARHTTLS